jgi:hypothetical protein
MCVECLSLVCESLLEGSALDSHPPKKSTHIQELQNTGYNDEKRVVKYCRKASVHNPRNNRKKDVNKHRTHDAGEVMLDNLIESTKREKEKTRSKKETKLQLLVDEPEMLVACHNALKMN